MPNKDWAVELRGLTKTYGACKAVDNVSLQLAPNKIYGLLGRNGAGKTTILNILSARLFASSGEANVFGRPAYENIDVLKQICLMEEKGFYDTAVRVHQVLTLAAGLYPNWDAAYARELVKLFELDPRKRYKQLSRGMESALGLIVGLASRAPLTIFDEPSLGLDAVMRERFYDAVLDDFMAHPRTIIISTHLIDEVSRLFEDVVIIDGGKVLLHTEAAALREKAFFISGREDAVLAAAKDAVVMDTESFGGTKILSVLAKDGLRAAEGVDVQPIPMQRLFVQLINHKNHEALRKGGVLK